MLFVLVHGGGFGEGGIGKVGELGAGRRRVASLCELGRGTLYIHNPLSPVQLVLLSKPFLVLVDGLNLLAEVAVQLLDGLHSCLQNLRLIQREHLCAMVAFGKLSFQVDDLAVETGGNGRGNGSVVGRGIVGRGIGVLLVGW